MGRNRHTLPKDHTYKDHKSKFKTQSEKLLHVSKVTSCCFILSFQGLEDSKGFINSIISPIITLHEGCRIGSLRHEHEECECLKNVASFVQKTQVIITDTGYLHTGNLTKVANVLSKVLSSIQSTWLSRHLEVSVHVQVKS